MIALLSAICHKFEMKGKHFYMDDKEFVFLSGEMHPLRIPEEYWRHRIQMAKAMGLNTIAFYDFWNMHELKNGSFDFTGRNNVSRFIEICAEEDMFVFFRPGPYNCAEINFGGVPTRYLKDLNTTIRYSDSTEYLEGTYKYIKAISNHIRKQMHHNGGNILLIQIENEHTYWDPLARDTLHLQQIKDAFLENQISGPFIEVNPNMNNVVGDHLKGDAFGLNGCPVQMRISDILTKDYVPVFMSELYPGWFRIFGDKSGYEPTDVRDCVKRFLQKNYSFSFYMLHGGTNFGIDAGRFYITSYDYGSPISESGTASHFYEEYRQLLTNYTGVEIPIPAKIPTIPIPAISLQKIHDITAIKHRKVEAENDLLHFERFGHEQGFGIYTTSVEYDGKASKQLNLHHMEDIIQIYINDTFVTRYANYYMSKDNIVQNVNVKFKVPEQFKKGDVLEIKFIVESLGHGNFMRAMSNDRKGILGAVTLDKHPLKLTLTLYDINKTADLINKSVSSNTLRNGVYKATFNLSKVGDTFFNMENTTRGFMYVNGHNLGRYWNTGPQFHLYCPGVWLKKGTNEIIIVEFERKAKQLTVFGMEDQLYKKGKGLNEIDANDDDKVIE